MYKRFFKFTLVIALAAGGCVQFGGVSQAPGPGKPADAGKSESKQLFFRVTDYGASGNGKTKDTQAIQKAIDAANQAGGGTVWFPPGTYLSGTVRLKSNVTLYLEAGAILLGTKDIENYPRIVSNFRSYTDNYTYQSLIYGENVQNVAIIGRGAIDGQGAKFKRKHPKRRYGERPYMIRFVSSQKIRLEGITLRNSPMWVQHYLACDNLVVDGITVHSQVNANNDGINIDCCQDVRIANCSITSGDDAIVLKSTADRVCKNVAVTNCVLSTHCNGLKLGTESNGGFKNITISNCALHDVNLAGIALEMVDGGTLDRVTVSNITMNKVGGAIFLRLGNRARPFRENMAKPAMGTFKNVIISNVIATEVGPVGSSITGLPGHPIKNVSLSNIKITYAGDGSKQDAARSVPERPANYPEYSMFGTLPAYGFYCRHVDGLTFRDIDVRWNKPDHRPALICDDVQNLQLDLFYGRRMGPEHPMIVLKDVNKVFIIGRWSPTITSSMISLQGETKSISVTTGEPISIPQR
ncbi:MAG: glycoside hydrolase family 28 protein [Planctomycetota bacterium]|nr:MAG: glycoside hydrolase family 28 protein [Planctomycetota bacterium]